jgi:hypothetical protein
VTNNWTIKKIKPPYKYSKICGHPKTLPQAPWSLQSYSWQFLLCDIPPCNTTHTVHHRTSLSKSFIEVTMVPFHMFSWEKQQIDEDLNASLQTVCFVL